jgi:hypothetical protein
MAAYKDEQRGTWYVSFHYYDWTGKNCRKVKRGFKTKREATEWERHFRMKEAADLDMTFEEFVQAYTRDIRSITGEYKRIEPDCREGVRTQLEHMKSLCKERESLYEKQNDLKGQKQKIERALER